MTFHLYNTGMETATHKALFFNVPGHGHVNPSLPLVAELTHRGHRITYFITPGYREQVESAGAAFRPIPNVTDDYFNGPKLNGSSPQYAAYTLMTKTEEILPELIETARDLAPDYVLFDGMCPWGYFLARVLQVPAVASLSLLQFPKPDLKMFLDPVMRRLFLSVLTQDPGKMAVAARISKQLGKRYGVPPLGPAELLNAFGDLSLSYTSAAFQPGADTVHPSVRFIGRSNPDTPEFPPGFFDRVGERPLVYISLGSLINDNKRFFLDCIDGFSGRREHVMISTGWRFRAEDFDGLPENVEVLAWVPQAAVLKRAALFISHGGFNSIHDALFYGVPLLLIPQQDEQAVNAARVVELGAGLTLTGGSITSSRLVSFAERLLQEASYKTQAGLLGESLRSAGGIPRAADEVEALLGQAG